MPVFQFVLADQILRFKQRPEHTFLGGTGADYVCAYAVDCSVEVVKSVVTPVESICANDFGEELESVVVHYGHVV